MAYRVNNVEYVNSSGVFSNPNLFKTIHGNSLLGSGNISTAAGAASSWGTSHNTLGSLCTGFNLSYTNASPGNTVAAGSLYHFMWTGGAEYLPMEAFRSGTSTLYGTGLSGTWMGMNHNQSNSSYQYNSLWLRVS